MLTKIWVWLDGNKTNIIAVLIAIAAGLTAKGIVIPEYVWILLGAAGLGAVRSAIKKLEG